MTILVALSKMKDGSMYNRHNATDPVVIENRKKFLVDRNINLNQTTRVEVNALLRATKQNEKDWCRYDEVGTNEKGDGMRDKNPMIADALITRENNHALLLPIADCTGTVIYDPGKHILMLTHLGRHSLEQNGGTKSVRYLVGHYGSNPSDLLIWLTPAPGIDNYPLWAFDNRSFKDVTFEQLLSAGIDRAHITDNPADSTTDPDYFSYSEFLKGHRTEDGDNAIVAMMRD